MNFDSNDRFSYRDGRLTKSEDGCAVADDFFTVGGAKNLENASRVESVSVVVGENGTGKTSLASFLNQVLAGGRAPCNYVFVVKKDGRFFCFENIGDRLDDGSLRKTYGDNWVRRTRALEDKATDATDFGILYYSPYFNATPTFPIGSSDAFVDLSTTGLLHRTLDMKDCAQREESTTLRMIERLGRKLKKSERGVGPLPSPGSFEIVPNREYVVSVEKTCANRSRGLSSLALFEDVRRRTRRKLEGDAHDERTAAYYYGWMCEALDIGDVQDPVLGVLAGYLAQWIDASQDREWVFRESESYLMKLCDAANAICVDVYDACRLDERRGQDGVDSRLRVCWSSLHAEQRQHVRGKAIKRLKDIRAGGESAIHRQFLAVIKAMASLCGTSSALDNGSYLVRVDGAEQQRMFYTLRNEYRELQKNDLFRRSFDFLSFGDSAMSSGERAFLSLMGRLDECIGDAPDAGIGDQRCNCNDLLLFLDEAETTLHPEWQRSLVKNVIWYIERFTRNRRVHVIFATHSPTLLSDIPSGNVVALPQRDDSRNECHLAGIQTFGLNVFDLYRGLFNTHDGMMGHFAKDKINDLLRAAGKRALSDPERQTVKLVGDPLIRDFLDRKVNP